MTRLNTFYLPPEAWGVRCGLDDAEAHHLSKVLRGRVGETVRLFDGQGREGLFRIAGMARRRVDLELIPDSERLTPPPISQVHLAVGWTRSARRDWLMEKAVELGCSGLHFWQAERSQGEVPDVPKPTWTARLIGAAKQCGATRLPELRTFASLDALLSAFAGFDRRLFLWEKAEEDRIVGCADLSGQGSVLAVLGPEGGFEDAEAERLLQAGLRPISLGHSVMRWETAALYLLSLFNWAGQALSAEPAE